MKKILQLTIVLALLAIEDGGFAQDQTLLTDADITELMSDTQHSETILQEFKEAWDQFSTDLRRSTPVYSSTERQQRLVQLIDTHWLAVDTSLRRLQQNLRIRSGFDPGSRLKKIANLPDVRRMVAQMVGDNPQSRLDSYSIQLKTAIESNRSELTSGSGTYGAEKEAWEARYLDPIDSYLFYIADGLGRSKMASATWPDITVVQLTGEHVGEMIEDGMFKSFDSVSFCSIEVRHSESQLGSQAFFARFVREPHSTGCQTSTDWFVLSCPTSRFGSCEGFPQFGDMKCQFYRPGLQFKEFDVLCSGWDRSFRFRK
jgi:hypothetical protein